MNMDISVTDPWALIAVAIAMTLGGILKGATGAGLPVIAVPVLASIYDVRVAVAVMVVPNLISNLRQVWKFRKAPVDPVFVKILAVVGALGVGLGTFVLAKIEPVYVQFVMIVIIVVYIGLRLSKLDLRITKTKARRWVASVGIIGGVLQGAVGISAPVAVTFLNAIRLDRPAFILTVSTFFAAMCVVQLPMQISFGIMTFHTALIGLLALIPLTFAMPIGEWIGSKFSARVFDRVILFFLASLAVKLLFDLF
ncbi:sulfite exporter TauE/SafE family protein [Pacificibacter marinus]|uniref:sulfite exporter TauE/SafE family protein n=1 Tax=Pacificibacter marinus TaxID=658057 RepID=UPI001C0702B8|nr:sulfite exporter TauE/SafE family protein [Pacificibacter marinus]MBU2868213.1 sulfite exporter TauE/SafE family protein [Pacificibacter marinus]